MSRSESQSLKDSLEKVKFTAHNKNKKSWLTACFAVQIVGLDYTLSAAKQLSGHARKPLWYRRTAANSELYLCSQTIKKKGHHSHQHVNLLRSISWRKAQPQHDRKHQSCCESWGNGVNHQSISWERTCSTNLNMLNPEMLVVLWLIWEKPTVLFSQDLSEFNC